MTKEELKNLQPGETIVNETTGNAYIVAANYGGRVTAISTIEVTDPTGWRVRALQSRPSSEREQWIPVSERLPESGRVLAYCEDGVFDVVANRLAELTFGKDDDESLYYTHWMPLPEPPTAATKEGQ